MSETLMELVNPWVELRLAADITLASGETFARRGEKISVRHRMTDFFGTELKARNVQGREASVGPGDIQVEKASLVLEIETTE